MVGTFTDSENLYLVIDYALNKDLSSFLSNTRKSYTSIDNLCLGLHNYTVRKYYVSQLVCIIEYLRSKRIVHRDLKPANLLLNEKWQLVLADFGTAKVLNELVIPNPLSLKKANSCINISQVDLIEENEPEQEPVGTEAYISPEAIDQGSNRE